MGLDIFLTCQSLQQTEVVINTTPPPSSYQNLYNLNQLQENTCRQKELFMYMYLLTKNLPSEVTARHRTCPLWPLLPSLAL